MPILLKWEIVMLLPRVRLLLSGELLKRPDHAETGVSRLYHVVDVAV